MFCFRIYNEIRYEDFSESFKVCVPLVGRFQLTPGKRSDVYDRKRVRCSGFLLHFCSFYFGAFMLSMTAVHLITIVFYSGIE